MGLMKQVSFLVVAYLCWRVYDVFRERPVPELTPQWWGPGEPSTEKTELKKFIIGISDQEKKLLRTYFRLPLRVRNSVLNSNFTYGFRGDVMEKIHQYWKDEYDWKKCEQRLAQYKHYKIQVDGLDLHFMTAPSKDIAAKRREVLLLLHGWPSSFLEYFDLIPLLTSPKGDSDVVFDLVIPSLPGFGFSDKSSRMGLNPVYIASLMIKMMNKLKIDKYYIHGGDWGSIIASHMAVLNPESVSGIHLSTIVANTPITNLKLLLGSITPPGFIVPKEDYELLYPLKDKVIDLMREMGYAHIQAVRPDTIGFGLLNSPDGLAAYILEKFSTWTHRDNLNKPDGGLLDNPRISLEKLMDNVALYWYTRTITSSMRLYAEDITWNNISLQMDAIPVRVPTGLAAFPQELIIFPESLAKHKFHDIVSYTKMARGGHFPALEVPELLASDIQSFVSQVVKRNGLQTNTQKHVYDIFK